MALAATILGTARDDKYIYVFGTLAASGNYTTGGDTLDLTLATWPIGQGPLQTLQPAVQGASFVNTSTGYGAAVSPGTTPRNTLIKFTSAAGTEVTQGAYPAALAADANIAFNVAFPFGN